MLDHFLSSARVARDFFLCDVADMSEVAKMIDDIQLPIKDRYTFCIAPVNTEDPQAMAYLRGVQERARERERPIIGQKKMLTTVIPTVCKVLLALWTRDTSIKGSTPGRGRRDP